MLIINNYDSFTYNLLAKLLALSPGHHYEIVENDRVSPAQAIERAILLKGLIISPGPGSPADSEICPQVVLGVPKDLPVLGVCLGMQILGELGGFNLRRSTNPRHGSVEQIQRVFPKSKLFKGLGSSFEQARYNSLCIEGTSSEYDITAIGTSSNNEIMAIEHKSEMKFGVQFHPESICSGRKGERILINFLKVAKVFD